MKILPIYKLIAGSKTEFTKPFKYNDTLLQKAQDFWDKLESNSMIIILIFVVLGFLLAIYYYQPYNNMPGRHYTPIHWFWFIVGTSILTFLVTLGFEYIALPPNLDGAFILELKIALGNAVYAALLFFIISWVWCQSKLPTNAYRFIKF